MSKFLWLLILSCCLVLGLTNCQELPSERQLDQWQHQAITLNQSITKTIADQNRTNQDQEWQLVIQGQIQQSQQNLTLKLSDLKKLPSQEIKTREPHNTEDIAAIKTFKGVTVASLLAKSGVAAEVKEVTFLSSNNYRVTVELEDLRNYPILLAWDRDAQPLTRSQGGPLYLVFPYTDYPELPAKYSDAYWAFYVTDMVVGNEPINLKVDSKPYDVGSRSFDRASLDTMPQTTITESVGYKLGWPAGKIKLRGVRLRDLMAQANLNFSDRGRMIVRSKSSLSSDRSEPVQLSAAEVVNCDIILATKWGEQEQPIPSKMGGPMTLAFSSNCQNNVTLSPKNNQHWATFVERIEVN